MSERIGYVVIEYNQASHWPSVLDGSFTDDLDWAGTVANDERAKTARVGRGERYAVAEVNLSDDSQWAGLP